jgi:hypothetical protein
MRGEVHAGRVAFAAIESLVAVPVESGDERDILLGALDGRPASGLRAELRAPC